MIEPKLKPCPFCGAKETDKDQPINLGWVIEDDMYVVRCDRCGASGAERDDRAEAIEEWNSSTEDAVVCCKYCRHWIADHKPAPFCRWVQLYRNEDDFCSYGERRINNV